MVTPALVFDIGGVLVPEGNRIETLQVFSRERLGSFDDAAFERAYWAHRDDYDLGCSDHDFWSQVFAAAGIESFTEDDVDAVAARDGQLNSSISSQAQGLLALLRAAPVNLAILSNAPRSMAQRVRDAEWSSCFAALIFSSDLNDHKPNDTIYTAVDSALAEAGCKPADLRAIHFFDDRVINVNAANAHGWSAHQWVDTETAESELRAVGILT